ncbi:ABC transporter permease [Shewanella glacialimarina]|uniref:ABC transporter permease n=1 Tax=Shewanella glacialimarina TaxID=2590884 RepID=UPI001CF84948|nr:ABC transporter permease [Shewanella glacialimarina]UCX06189.1 ABC transporter permease [Shewanella glacialimarina]
MLTMMDFVKREWRALWQSPWQLALVTYIPIVSVLCLWWLFSAGLPRQLPVAVVDLDNSQISRMLTRKMSANAVMKLESYGQLDLAIKDMREAKVYAIVVIPYQFKYQLLTSKSPTIDIRYNSQYLLVGKLLSSQIQMSLGAGLSKSAEQKLLMSGVNHASIAVNLSPVTSQTTALFNRNNNYVGFLVPPVLIALWQLLAMMVFSNALNKELITVNNQVTLPQDLWIKVLAKCAVFLPIMLLHSSFILLLLYQYLQLPYAGALGVLIIAQAFMLIALWLLVTMIFLMMKDSARCVSFCTALFAPAFAFMGITFPVNEMPELAQYWRLLMPSSHYIDSHVSVVSYGADSALVLQQLSSYWMFIFIIPVIVGLWHRAPKAFGDSVDASLLNNSAPVTSGVI